MQRRIAAADGRCENKGAEEESEENLAKCDEDEAGVDGGDGIVSPKGVELVHSVRRRLLLLELVGGIRHVHGQRDRTRARWVGL